MEGLDIFATKGAEYLFCSVFLLVLAGFWKLLTPPPLVTRRAAGARVLPQWFEFRDDRWFHQGHAWAAPAGGREITVGMDDFAQKLLGRPAGIALPKTGTHVTQGEPAWRVQVNGHAIPMLSPIDGEVVAVNREVAASPALVNAEPYDRGWLLRVKVNNPDAAKRNLLHGPLAKAWMDGVAEQIRVMPVWELGVVLPDGGFPVEGFARALSPGAWDRLAREFLLSE